MATLVRVDASAVLPLVVDVLVNVFSLPALVTVTQREYDVMRTPEGTLFDKSIIER